MTATRFVFAIVGLLAAIPQSQADTAKADILPAEAKLSAWIDLSKQQMQVYVDNVLVHVWKVSTGRKPYSTPAGTYQPDLLSPRHRSRKYNWAPMPWSVFYYRGYAVHGTTEVRNLGRPASHGCVRLHPDNAKVFFNLVKEHGLKSTVIKVVQSADLEPPAASPAPAARIAQQVPVIKAKSSVR